MPPYSVQQNMGSAGLDPSSLAELAFNFSTGSLPRPTHSRAEYNELVEECLRELKRQSRRGGKHARNKRSRSKYSEAYKLDPEELTNLASRVMSVRSTVGTARFVRCLTTILQRAGVPEHDSTVTWSDLSVETDATVGTNAINTIVRAVFSLGGLISTWKKVHVHLLKPSSGIIKPGRATLLLGPPGAGKSMLMKVLSGRLTAKDRLTINGEIRYNGKLTNEFNVRRSASYVDQQDNHIADLTVRETLLFALQCLTPEKLLSQDLAHNIALAAASLLIEGRRICGLSDQSDDEHLIDILDSLPLTSNKTPNTAELFCGSEEENRSLLKSLGELVTVMKTAGDSGNPHELQVDIFLAILGLTVCKDTMVGDVATRGISGGQRKRLTSGEYLVGPAGVMFLDEISTGLDSATTFNVAQYICETCRQMNITMVMGLLQPPPETVQLFDDILLLADGHVVYHGPRNGVLDFFSSLGFECPPRKDKANFLQEVTTAVGQHMYATEELKQKLGVSGIDIPDAQKKHLISSSDIAESFLQTPIGKERSQAIATHHKLRSAEPSKDASLMTTKYSQSFFALLYHVLVRQAKLVQRDKNSTSGRIVQCIVMGIFTGLLFLQLPKTLESGRSYMGVMYVAIMFLALGNAPQVGILLKGRTVFTKHRDNLFYHGMSYCLALTITQTPVAIVEVASYTLPVYFMVGFHTSAMGYISFYSICLSCSLGLGAFFRALAAWSKSLVMANSVMIFFILLLILISGFTITVSDIPSALIWVYWISPFAWSFKASAVSELLRGDWDFPTPVMLPECTTLGNGTCTAGELLLNEFGIPINQDEILYCILFNLLVFVVLTAVASAGMSVLKPPHQEAVVLASDDSSTAKKTNKMVRIRKNSVAPATSDEAMPLQALALVWKDIHYFVPMPKCANAPKDGPKELELLKGITGHAKPSSLTALMGGSGAGKTTLMDVLAGRKTVGRITGDILVNGREKEQKTWARVCGYVEQEDIHMPNCTVREALEFSADLRLDGSVSPARAARFVQEVMDMVDLNPIADRVIGELGGVGLSMEQRKRLSIGVELVFNPGVIFMDEPTSGLDAKAAATVIRAAESISKSGRTVMITIHQPSIEVFEAFDQLLLLQKGGHTLYFGPIGQQSADLTSYFRSYPGVADVPLGYNPATWMLEITGGAPQTVIPIAPYCFEDAWETSEIAQEVAAECDRASAECLATARPVQVDGVYAKSIWMQFRLLLHRFHVDYWRDPGYNLTRWLMSLVQALLFGGIYYGQGKLDPGETLTVGAVFNVLGLAYSSTLFTGLGNLMTAIPAVTRGRTVFYRERAVRMYGVLPYAAAASFIEVPYIAVQVLIFVPIVYLMIQFDLTVEKLLYYAAMTFVSQAVFTFYGQFTVFLTPDDTVALILAGGLSFFWNVFSGFTIPTSQMPDYLAWITYLCPTTYIMDGLCTILLGDNDLPLEVYGESTTVSAYLQDYMGYRWDRRYWNLLIVVAFCLAFILAGSASLRAINYNIR